MELSTRKLDEYLESETVRGVFPGAQYLIGEDQKIVAEGAIGWAVVEPQRIAVNLNTIYDLASLTKPLVTSLLTIMFAERGLIDLNAPVARYLNNFSREHAGEEKSRITLIHLLTHTSGLPAWLPLYYEVSSTNEVPDAIARAPLESPPDTAQVVYSDLNYILLGHLLEQLSGYKLDALAHKEIFEPLKLERTMFNPPAQLMNETAATERGQVFEQANAGRGTSIVSPWRTEIIWGQVHDGNAYFLGGVAGHAGLFSTSREVFKIANQFLRGSKLLKPESLHLFTDNFTAGRGSDRSLGWVLGSTLDCSAGLLLPPTAIGHTGFTGTSVWMDPGRRRVFVFLTNRVHPEVGSNQMKTARQNFNSLAVELLDSRQAL